MSSPAPGVPPYAVSSPVRPAGPGKGIAALVFAILTVGLALLVLLPTDQYVGAILLVVMSIPLLVLVVLTIIFGILAIRSGQRTSRWLGIIALVIVAAFGVFVIGSTIIAAILLTNQTY